MVQIIIRVNIKKLQSLRVCWQGGPCCTFVFVLLRYLHLRKLGSSDRRFFVDVANFSFECYLRSRFCNDFLWHCLNKGFLFSNLVYCISCTRTYLLAWVYSPFNRVMLLNMMFILLFCPRRGMTMNDIWSSTMSPSWNVCGPAFLNLLSSLYAIILS